MRSRPIEEVSVSAEDGLRICPQLAQFETFSYIYRAAAGIRWLESCRCLGASEPARWEHIELFKHIIAIVESECGETLTLTANTRWLGVPTKVRKSLQSCA